MTRFVTFTPKKTKDNESELKYEMRKQFKRQPFDVALKLEVAFYMRRPKSRKKALFHKVKWDLDNLIKQLSDAGNGILWKDDSIIVEIHTTKSYSPKESGYIVLNITPLEDETKKTPKPKP